MHLIMMMKCERKFLTFKAAQHMCEILCQIFDNLVMAKYGTIESSFLNNFLVLTILLLFDENPPLYSHTHIFAVYHT